MFRKVVYDEQYNKMVNNSVDAVVISEVMYLISPAEIEMFMIGKLLNRDDVDESYGNWEENDQMKQIKF